MAGCALSRTSIRLTGCVQARSSRTRGPELGLRRLDRETIEATADHVGSVVVMLSRADRPAAGFARCIRN